MRTLSLIPRLPGVGYLDASLWAPKSKINADGVKNALTFALPERGGVRVFALWKETTHHLIVPREFWKPADMDFPVIDCRHATYAHVPVTSRITLDHLPDARGVLQPTGKTVQRDALHALLGARGGLLQLACGVGKTVVALEYIARTQVPTLIVMDNAQLLGQWAKELERHLDVPGGVGLIQGPTFDWKKGVVLSTYQTLALRADTFPEEARRWFGTIIWDECFVAGTLVDGRPIETLRVGDRIRSLNHRTGRLERRPITRIYASAAKTLLRLVTSGGASFVVTPRHPFYTQRGYVPAQELTHEDFLYHASQASSPSPLRVVPGTYDGCQEVAEGQTQEGCPDLLRQGARAGGTYGALVEDHGRDQPKVCLGADDTEQPHAARTHTRKDGSLSSEEGSSPADTGRERSAAEYPAEATTGFSGLAGRVCGADPGEKGFGPIYPLQAGPGASASLGGDRGRWPFPCKLPGARARCQEGDFPPFTRVDRLEVLEQGDLDQLREMYPENLVYNLEVDGNYNYFVNDFLVHNCHHVAAPTFSRTADLFEGTRIGLSATPTRSDGLHVIYDAHIGGVLFKHLKQELKPRIYFKWTGLAIDKDDALIRKMTEDKNGELHIGKIAAWLGRWPARLDMIITLVKDARAEGRKVLVLSQSIDELVNLYALWQGKSPYTDLPTPTANDLGETLTPQELSPAQSRTLHKRLAMARALMNDTSQHALKRQHARDGVAAFERTLQAHDVWKKLDTLQQKQQRAYVKELVALPSDAGLMIYQVDPKLRAEMLATKNVIFAVMKYGREGLDSPSLDTSILCEPMSSRNALQQFLGRILRHKEGKKSPVAVILEDDIGPMIGMCHNLRRHLRDWPPEEGGPFPYENVDHPTSFKKQGKLWTKNSLAFG